MADFYSTLCRQFNTSELNISYDKNTWNSQDKTCNDVMITSVNKWNSCHKINYTESIDKLTRFKIKFT